MLNGIGGKLESDETPFDAMNREFKEETDCHIDGDKWNRFVILEGNDWVVHFFYTYSDKIYDLKSMEEEQLEIHNVSDIVSLNTIPNLNFLIPMSLYSNIHFGRIYIDE